MAIGRHIYLPYRGEIIYRAEESEVTSQKYGARIIIIISLENLQHLISIIAHISLWRESVMRDSGKIEKYLCGGHFRHTHISLLLLLIRLSHIGEKLSRRIWRATPPQWRRNIASYLVTYAHNNILKILTTLRLYRYISISRTSPLSRAIYIAGKRRGSDNKRDRAYLIYHISYHNIFWHISTYCARKRMAAGV